VASTLTVVVFDAVVAVRRLFGQPDYFVYVAVADHDAFEAFPIGSLIRTFRRS
jgi:hypothetical protein